MWSVLSVYATILVARQLPHLVVRIVMLVALANALASDLVAAREVRAVIVPRCPPLGLGRQGEAASRAGTADGVLPTRDSEVLRL